MLTLLREIFKLELMEYDLSLIEPLIGLLSIVHLLFEIYFLFSLSILLKEFPFLFGMLGVGIEQT